LIFPSTWAMRRFQWKKARDEEICDCSSHYTFSSFFTLLETHLSCARRQPNASEKWLYRREAVERARGRFKGASGFIPISTSGLTAILKQFEYEIAQLPDQADSILAWMEQEHASTHRLYHMMQLYRAWVEVLASHALDDQVKTHQQILALLRAEEHAWPSALRAAEEIIYRDVRWLSPFEEICLMTLFSKCNVCLESALPAAHAEESALRFNQQVLFNTQTTPWAGWAEEIGDALAMDSHELLSDLPVGRLHFSRSAGAYGEIEDIARRIAYYVREREHQPHEIAVVVPNLSLVQDIIPHVFNRFKLPYYFRRGRPVLSSPVVKAFVSWLSFPLEGDRDTLIDLIRHPALYFEDREKQVTELVERFASPQLDGFSLEWFKGTETLCGEVLLERFDQWLIEPEDHFNQAAKQKLQEHIEGMRERSLSLADWREWICEGLANETIQPARSHEHGVFILNMDDAAGMEFEVLFLAILNEGLSPTPLKEHPLFTTEDIGALRKVLEKEEQSISPMALPDRGVRLEQQRVSFMATLGMARNELVCSTRAINEEGTVQVAGRYYRELWELGKGFLEHAVQPDTYDQWRMDQLPSGNFLGQHFERQRNEKECVRDAPPGESFLEVVPPALAVGAEEYFQSALINETPRNTHQSSADQSSALYHDLIRRIEMEYDRVAYVDADPQQRAPSVYCGHLPELIDLVQKWLDEKEALSPTTLETLTHCRYLFLLEKILGVNAPEKQEIYPNPMKRGSLMHEIFYTIYSRLATGEAALDLPQAWAIRTASGWKKSDTPEEGALPLVVLPPEALNTLLAYAEKTAKACCMAAWARSEALGHPAIWQVEEEKLIRFIRAVVQYDVENAWEEQRYPALFEFAFSADLGVKIGDISIKGKIDRIDLCFDATGHLSHIEVLDYKGSSREETKKEKYVQRVMQALDCQLPLYGFAAQQLFFDAYNTPECNARTKAGYLIQAKDCPSFAKKRKTALLNLDAPDLINRFNASLLEQVQRIQQGDFSVDPYHASYSDLSSILRTEPVKPV
jgi:ATP-dependent helicase/DNAse subunit B